MRHVYVCLPVKKPITFVCAAAPAVGLLRRDVVFLWAALIASVENQEVAQDQEGLLGASKEFQGRLKLQPFCLDLSVCMLAFKSALAGLFVLVQHDSETWKNLHDSLSGYP